jgi:hypothetical protein
MAFRNAKLSHNITAPCRICKTPTPALVKGVVQRHPVCEECSAEMAKQFAAARRQADAQFHRSNRSR